MISGFISFSFARSILLTIWSNRFLKSILIYSHICLCGALDLMGIEVRLKGYRRQETKSTEKAFGCHGATQEVVGAIGEDRRPPT